MRRGDGRGPLAQGVRRGDGRVPLAQEVRRGDGRVPLAQEVRRGDGRGPLAQEVEQACLSRCCHLEGEEAPESRGECFHGGKVSESGKYLAC